jgi:hypothetical protein
MARAIRGERKELFDAQWAVQFEGDFTTEARRTQRLGNGGIPYARWSFRSGRSEFPFNELSSRAQRGICFSAGAGKQQIPRRAEAIVVMTIFRD